MNPKIEKLKAERAKNNEKILTLQTRNKVLDGQIAELENTEIVGLVRDNGLTPSQLAQLIRAMKTNPVPALSSHFEERKDIEND